ncbi:MAG TPA: ATP-binding protein [Baekduia sp.]|nr:ATP-binding protein [Baekduia sp.]
MTAKPTTIPTAWRGPGLDLPLASGEAAVALLRVLLIPIIFVGERQVAHPTDRSGAFGYLLVAGAVYALVLLAAMAVRHRRGRLAATAENRGEPFVDLALICALVYTSGGPFSQARVAFFALPLVAAFRLRPRLTACWSAIAVVAYVGVSVSHPAVHDQDAPGQVLTGALYLAWAGLAAVVLSSLLAARAERIRHMAEERRSLVRQALEAESRERRRLAAVLHDQPVQTLLVARQDLREARRGEVGALDRAEAALRMSIDQLRSEIIELHSHVLDHAGLGAALDELAQRCSQRTGIAVAAKVAPEATGQYDELLFLAAQELVDNAIQHASARAIAVTLGREDGHLELAVVDDGAGIDAEGRAVALSQGQLGLATLTERVQAVGGRLELQRRRRGGTAAVVMLPVKSAPPAPTGRPDLVRSVTSSADGHVARPAQDSEHSSASKPSEGTS